MRVKTIVTAAIITFFTANVYAQTSTARPVSTIKNDRQRIKQGVNSGELNRAEAARLKVQTAKLAKERREIRSDGVVTTEERKDYRQDKKQVSRRIYRQKHDRQTR